MFGRLILVIGWLATLIFVGNGALGLFGPKELAILRIHLMMGLAATMLLIFSHGWLAIYLGGMGRLFRDLGYEGGASRVRLGQRMAILVLLLATVNFVLGVMRLAGDFEMWVHVGAVVVCLVVQIAAQWLQWKAVEEVTDGLATLRIEGGGGA